MARRDLALEFSLFAASVGAFQGSRLLVSLIAATVLSPSDFGLWALFITVLGYANFASLGILNGANRELPIAIGEQEHERAGEIERNAYGGAILAGLACAIIAGAVGSLLGDAGGWLVGAVLLAQQGYLFVQVSLRSRLQFNNASLQQFLLAGVFLVVGTLALRAGLDGLLGAQLAAYGTGLLVAVGLWRRTLRPRFDRGEMWRLVRAGFPIMLGGLAFAALTSIDRWIVAAALGPESLGHYSLGALVASGMILVAVIVGQQFYPRMAMRFGATKSRQALLPMARAQSAIALAIVLPLVIALWIGAPLGVPVFAPEYSSSVPVLQILLVGMVALTAATGYSNTLVATGHATRYLTLQILAIALQATVGIGAVIAGMGLVGVALASAFTFSVFAILVIWTAHDVAIREEAAS